MAMAAAAAYNRGGGGGGFQVEGDRVAACAQQRQFWVDVHEKAHFQELKAMINKFDKDGSGDLDASELRECIKAYEEAHKAGPKSAKLELNPTDEEISLILKTAGRHKARSVDASEIEVAIDLWHSYVYHRENVERVFQKYDTDHSQKLDHDQLANYLADLHGGKRPKDSEVTAIMKDINALDGVSRVQLTIAASHWYTHLSEERHKGSQACQCSVS